MKDFDKYLKRIGMEQPVGPNLESLDRIIYAHQCAIPFENIEVYYNRRTPDLSHDAVFEKIVEQHKGGYCFEMNNLLYQAICELGFEAYPCMAKVLGDGGPAKDTVIPAHRGTVVIMNGQRRYCDVGFGGPIPGASILLEPGIEQEILGDTFRFLDEGDPWLALQRKTKGKFVTLFWVNPTPVYEAEYEALNFYCANNPEGHFVQTLILNRRTPDGHVSIDGDKFIRTTKDDGRTETPITDEGMLRTLIGEYFDLPLDWK